MEETIPQHTKDARKLKKPNKFRKNPEEPTPVSETNENPQNSLGKPETNNTTNISCSASNDQIIIFLTHMIMAFTEGRTEIEVISFIKTAADKLLNQKTQTYYYGN